MKTNKIIIVGGGSAGWMAAATLISQFPQKDITVIESPNVPTVGVGESTLGQINTWLDLLGIKDEDFMPYTDASYKLSIRFEDFYQKGDGGFHYPFGIPVETQSLGLKQLWFLKKYLNPNVPVSDYANSIYVNMALVNNNVLFKNEDNELPNFNFKNDVAYHFDAAKFGLWLRENYCKPKGVKHILEDVKTIEQNEDGITSLNNTHRADMFIDCTGFKSLLLGDTLQEHFNDYSHLLPNNKAWATRVPYRDKEQELQPYTNCTAIENGWVWNIPSWERIGTGYVYSDKYVSDEEALNEFKRHLDTKGRLFSKRV
jgi:flavin-dependent dehydrogenase